MAKREPQPTESAVVVELPKEVVRILGANRAEEIVLIDLRRRGLISGGYAARELGITKAELIDLLAKYEVPYLDLSEDALRAGRQAIWDHLNGAGP